MPKCPVHCCTHLAAGASELGAFGPLRFHKVAWPMRLRLAEGLDQNCFIWPWTAETPLHAAGYPSQGRNKHHMTSLSRTHRFLFRSLKQNVTDTELYARLCHSTYLPKWVISPFAHVFPNDKVARVVRQLNKSISRDMGVSYQIRQLDMPLHC